MKEVVVISGKGGTGKTFLTSSLAVISSNKVILDCDVDAANLYLILEHKVLKEEDFLGSQKPIIDYDKCTKCGLCEKLCRFSAIDEEIKILENLCEGCGLCALICPQDAIQMVEEVNGRVFISDSKYGPFVYAKLGIGAENSGKLVTRVRNLGRDIALSRGLDLILIDGPPGIGCPVIASLTGASFALIVTEPTYSGIHDMQRVVEIALHFGAKVGIVINKCDINLKNTEKIKDYAKAEGLSILGEIPFSEKVAKAITQAKPYPQLYKDEITQKLYKIWQGLEDILNET
jgi:MinD superfamily P-loop ATPase